MKSELNEQSEVRKISYQKYVLLAVCILLIIVLFISRSIMNPPHDFPINTPVVIESGLTASEVVDELKNENVITSELLLYAGLVLTAEQSNVKAGTYVFQKPYTTFEVLERITGDAPPSEVVKVTFPEGFAVEDYARIADESLSAFEAKEFLQLASTSEGFLFPETYFVPENFTAEQLYTLLRDTFESKTVHLRDALSSDKLTESGIIILASIIEREANTPESMQVVAGILLSRMTIGMPLQTDASIEYVLDKPLSELTPDDLKIDSPYNTYLNKGLPPTPIGNPGLTAIEAVLNPTETPYVFYITGNDGEFYYAETLEEHNRNIDRYLR